MRVDWSTETDRYSTAAVECLALRAHGGQAGHKAHLWVIFAGMSITDLFRAQLEVRAEKAHATRKKNGTLKKKKRGCSCPFQSYGGEKYQQHAWWSVQTVYDSVQA